MHHPPNVLAALDRLIIRRRVRDYSWIILALSAAATTWYFTVGDYPISGGNDVVFPDFQARWTGARLLLDGRVADLYDPDVQGQLQQTLVPGSVGLSWFVSPPSAAILYLPYALFSYSTAAALRGVALVAMLTASVLLARRLLPDDDRDYWVLAVAFLASPPVFEVLITGQDSIGVLLTVVAAIRLLLRGRDTAAGAVLAFGVFKPHMFVLAPVALLVQRRWKAAAICAGLSVAAVAATLPVVGLAAWRAWLAVLSSPKFESSVQGGQAWLMQSVSSMLTELGAPHWVAYPILLAGTVLVAARLWGETDTLRVWAVVLLGTVVLSPHVLTYDLVVLLPVMVYLHRAVNVRTVRLSAVALVLVLWSAGPRHIVAVRSPGWGLLDVPWSAVLLAVVFWLMLRLPRPDPPDPFVLTRPLPFDKDAAP